MARVPFLENTQLLPHTLKHARCSAVSCSAIMIPNLGAPFGFYLTADHILFLHDADRGKIGIIFVLGAQENLSVKVPNHLGHCSSSLDLCVQLKVVGFFFSKENFSKSGCAQRSKLGSCPFIVPQSSIIPPIRSHPFTALCLLCFFSV